MDAATRLATQNSDNHINSHHHHHRKHLVHKRIKKKRVLDSSIDSSVIAPEMYLMTAPIAAGGKKLPTFSLPLLNPAQDSTLETLYDTLHLTQEDRDINATLNTIPPKDPSEWREDANGLYAASFRQLLLFITDPDAPNIAQQKIFLVTFPSFATPPQVLGGLLARYYSHIDPTTNVPDAATQNRIRSRMVRILSSWFKFAPYQFDQVMKNTILQFAGYLESESAMSATVLRNTINPTASTVNQKACPQSLPFPKNASKMSQIPPLELARQITIYHSSILLELGEMELLTAIWGAKKGGGSPHVDELTHHFDFLSRHISGAIISESTPKTRASLYLFWVEVAQSFLELQNFHGVFAVCYGLTHRSVERMSETMKQVGKQFKGDLKKKWDNIVALCDFAGDYVNYRPVIEKAVNPCIPFVGCFQKSLIYVQEGFPNKVDGLINFKKLEACAGLIKEVVEKFKYSRYFYTEIPEIQNIIKNIPNPMESAELMKISIEKEKKKK